MFKTKFNIAESNRDQVPNITLHRGSTGTHSINAFEDINGNVVERTVSNVIENDDRTSVAILDNTLRLGDLFLGTVENTTTYVAEGIQAHVIDSVTVGGDIEINASRRIDFAGAL